MQFSLRVSLGPSFSDFLPMNPDDWYSKNKMGRKSGIQGIRSLGESGELSESSESNESSELSE